MIWLLPVTVIMWQQLILSETLAFSERCGCNTYLTEFPLETIGIMYVTCYTVHCKFPVIYLKILSQG